jgi:hypothetical protein
LRQPRTNHCAGRHPSEAAPLATYYGITEAPGRPGILQEAYLRALVADQYQYCWFSLNSGVSDDAIRQRIQEGRPAQRGEEWPDEWPHPYRHIEPYDGYAEILAGGGGLVQAWVQQLVAAKIVPCFGLGTQGAPSSWDLIRKPRPGYPHGYDNQWAVDNIATIARTLWDWTEGHAVFIHGWESDKKYAPREGPGDLWGFAALETHWAAEIKEVLPQSLVLTHFLPEVLGPHGRIDGDRDWDEDTWLAWAQHIDGVAWQTELDGQTVRYYHDVSARLTDKLHRHGKLSWAGEFARPNTVASIVDARRAGMTRDGYLN